MNEKGIWGAFVLLSVVQVFFGSLDYYNQINHSLGVSTSRLLLVEKATFERTVAEIAVDRAIPSAMYQSSVPFADSGKIKTHVDSKVIEVLRAGGFEKIGICSETFYGVKFNAADFGDTTKVIAIRAKNIIFIDYLVSGNAAREFPCALIEIENFSLWFFLPIGYSVQVAVPSL